MSVAGTSDSSHSLYWRTDSAAGTFGCQPSARILDMSEIACRVVQGYVQLSYGEATVASDISQQQLWYISERQASFPGVSVQQACDWMSSESAVSSKREVSPVAGSVTVSGW